MPLFDAHNHLDDARFDGRRDVLLARARDAGIGAMVIAGYGPSRWSIQNQLCREVAGCFATYGVHPWAVSEMDDIELAAALESLASALRSGTELEPHLVGLGELGLDRSSERLKRAYDTQTVTFRAQLGLARELNLPIVLHVVHAHGVTLEFLKRDGLPAAGGLVHGFTGSLETANAYRALGLMLSIGSVVTRPSARKLRRAVHGLDAEGLLLETDAPDQLPFGCDTVSGLNEPANLVHVRDAVASLRGITQSSLAASTWANAVRLFGLEDRLPVRETLVRISA